MRLPPGTISRSRRSESSNSVRRSSFRFSPDTALSDCSRGAHRSREISKLPKPLPRAGLITSVERISSQDDGGQALGLGGYGIENGGHRSPVPQTQVAKAEEHTAPQ